jgi:tetratricopeptide (TPR) repeat protein
MAYPLMTGPFIGRIADLTLLVDLLADAVGGGPVLAVIGGEAGVGKTRLVGQLAATASERGVRVLRGGCVQLGGEGLPFAPLIEALRGLASELDPSELATVAGPARQELARLLHDPAWAGGRSQGDNAAGYGPGRLFDLLLGVVERLSANAPLLLVIEDLHWADHSTRDLVAFLTAYLRSGRVMVALTFRSDELHRLHPLCELLAELARNRRVSRLELARFTRGELAEQLTGLLGDDPPARLLEDVYARSEGNPLFAEELVMAAERAGADALPPSLQEVLLARVASLGAGTQQVLGAAAVAGPGVTQAVLAAVTGLGEAELLDSLREAVDQQVLLPGPAGDGYAFRHALTAEAVYGELLPGERVRLHTALTGILEAGTGPAGPPAARAARLAHHWAAAGDQLRAFAASIDAAAAAEQVYAFSEAALQLERVLGLWDQVPDAEERAGGDRLTVLSRCANAASWAGNIAHAAQLVRQAAALTDEARQPQRLGLLRERLGCHLESLGDPGWLAEMQEAVRLVAAPPSPERALVVGSLAWHLALAGRFAEARVLAEEAAVTAAQTGARAQEATARRTLGLALAHLGEPAAGLAELDAAHRLAAEAGDLLAALRAIVTRCDVLLAAGRADESAQAALGGMQEASRHGLARTFGPVLAARITVALIAAGRWEEAERISREALDIALLDADSVALFIQRAALDLGRGDFDAAEARLRTARRVIPVSHPGWDSGPVRRPCRAGAVARRPEAGQEAGSRGRAAGRGEPEPCRTAVCPRHAHRSRPRRERPGPPARRNRHRLRRCRRLARSSPAGRFWPGRHRPAGTGSLERDRARGNDTAGRTRRPGSLGGRGSRVAAARPALPGRLRLLPAGRGADGPRQRPGRGSRRPWLRRRRHRPAWRAPARRRGQGPGAARPPGPGARRA